MIPIPGSGLSSPARTREDGRDTLAVFDLDGTLIHGDSFLPFLFSYAQRTRRLWPVATIPVYAGLYAAKMMSDRDAKERLIQAFFRDQPRSRIDDHADWFCESWVRPRLRENTVARLRKHQSAGHRVILLSASPDLFVPRIGRYLGIGETVCTRVRYHDGVCSGRLAGPNCKGPNKVTLLREHLGLDRAPERSHAYGDSTSDLPILRWVEEGYLLRKQEFVRVRAVECA